MEEEGAENVIRSPEEIEYEQTVARYDDILSKLKLLRTRLLMNSANLAGDFSKGFKSPEALNITQSLTELEGKFNSLSIQEDMLKEIKISKLACELVTSDVPYEGLDALLKEHCANQARLLELAKSIQSEKQEQQSRIERLLDRLSEYTASLKDDQVQLDGNSVPDSETTVKLKSNMEKQIKEIRFMQICISQIIVNKHIDLRNNEAMKNILKFARNPVTSIEYFI